MTTEQEKKLAKLEAKEANRKVQVKKYFARRNVKFAVYKAHFEKTATQQQKDELNKKLADM
jgi:hypothetical protein